MARSLPTLLWVDTHASKLVTNAADLASLDVIALGGPEPNELAVIADHFQHAPTADLRDAINQHQPDLVWIASRHPLTRDERLLIHRTPSLVVASEPAALIADDLSPEGSLPRPLPLFRHSAGFRSALDVLDEIGAPTTAAVCFLGASEHGSLLARLFDAMDLVLNLLGPIDGLYASLSGPDPRVPESLHALRGTLTAQLRCAGGLAATILVSDQSPQFSRQVTLQRPGGVLQITDAACVHLAPSDVSVEREDPVRPPSLPELFATHIRRALDGLDPAPTDPPCVPADTVLAVCDTALLSCRTSSVETPLRLLQMRQHP